MLRRPMPGDLERLPREKITLHHYGTLIRTNDQTTPGCSGGVLLDQNGNVLAVTTALAGIPGDQPGGFAIPLDSSMRQIIAILKEGREVEYGFLGVILDRIRGSTRLLAISPGSPASKAGLMPGDWIVRINDNPVRDTNDLFLYLGMTLAGNEATIQVSRGPGGFTRTVKVRLAKFYWPGTVIAAHRPPARFGLRVDYTSVLAQRNPFLHRWGRGPADGVAIREVVPGSPADRARLQPDKIITHVNGEAVLSPAEFYREMARAGNRVELTYLNSRNSPERITLEQK
jgi:S1-C subfamily serine protease